jgi:hypothetical protein
MEDAMRVARRMLSFDTDRETMNYLRVEMRRIMPEAYSD